MRRKNYRPYIFLALFFVAIFSLPISFVHSLRSCVISSLSPFCKTRKKSDLETALKVENHKLLQQNENLRKRLLSDERIEIRLKKLKSFEELKKNTPSLKKFYERRKEQTLSILEKELKYLFSRVIYRDPNAWSSVLWIESGTCDNEKIEETVIEKGSLVLSRGYLIGIVEEVEKKKSKVRLITDGALAPSVRAIRGGEKNREILATIDLLMEQLSLNTGNILSSSKEKEIFERLAEVKIELKKQTKESYLAKGELCGTSSSYFRGCSSVLKGKGFNYDFADIEGPALELRSGKPIDSLMQTKEQTLLQVGDLLVTTGLDGVFPADLPVAMVSKVDSLEEGAISYAIEASLCAGDLNALEDVVIFPAMTFSDCS